jgi:hypothetical protein
LVFSHPPTVLAGGWQEKLKCAPEEVFHVADGELLVEVPPHSNRWMSHKRAVEWEILEMVQ